MKYLGNSVAFQGSKRLLAGGAHKPLASSPSQPGAPAPWAVGTHPSPAHGCCLRLLLAALPGCREAGGELAVAPGPASGKVVFMVTLSL